MSIKKAYIDIINLLEANESRKVSSILDEVRALASCKTAGGGGASTFHRNEEGEVDAIRCYYFKTWMDPRVVEFGKKASSSTGYNTMCKEGVSNWTRQQRIAKAEKASLLSKVSDGTLAVEDIAQAQEDIELAAAQIIPREDGYGFETLEELLATNAG